MSPLFSLGRTRRRASASGRGSERGVTVVEMLVASFLLGVGVMGVAVLFVASARSGAVADRQADATDVASGELEIIRAMAYDEVGIASDADGYVPIVDGRPTVTEPGPNLVLPLGTANRDGITYDIERSVTWVEAGTTGTEFKTVVVSVRWDSTAGERQVTLQTGLYEGSSGG
jgi:hypothetical protein